MNELGDTERANPKKYDTTIARMAGNIAAGLVSLPFYQDRNGRPNTAMVAVDALRIAIVMTDDLRATPMADLAALASACRKLLPPALLAEMIGHLDPLTPFVTYLREQATETP